LEKINSVDIASYIVAKFGYSYLVKDGEVYINIPQDLLEECLDSYKQSVQRKLDRVRKTLIGTIVNSK
jgi:hypothetical protein